MDTSDALVSRETATVFGQPPAGDPLRGLGNKRLKNGRKVRVRVRDGVGILKIGTFNANGMNERQKRRMVIEDFNESELDVLGIQETHMIGEGTDGREDEWEGLKGYACWSGLSDNYVGRKKEGVAILISERMREIMIDGKHLSLLMGVSHRSQCPLSTICFPMMLYD